MVDARTAVVWTFFEDEVGGLEPLLELTGLVQCEELLEQGCLF